MEKETRNVLLVIYFIYIIGMSIVAITVPEKVDTKGGWIGIGVILGITLVVLIVDACVGRHRRHETIYDSEEPFLRV